ncbi:hypothetical protein [Streptomyces sp. NPDC046909]|uniref:hypothetical protein n=1 Tax=Streptomyces sp. NPDC046909 TaxID=3155617 RepID=UPI0033F3EC10
MPDGSWHGNAVDEDEDATTVLTAVADAAQSTVMELLWQAWPTCREHKSGAHVRPAGTDVVWWCRGGGEGECHDVSLVGELAATPLT